VVKARFVAVVTALAAALGFVGAPAATAADTYALTVTVLSGTGKPLSSELVEVWVAGSDPSVDANSDGIPDARVAVGNTSSEGGIQFRAIAEGDFTVRVTSPYDWNATYDAPVTIAGGPVSISVIDQHVATVSGTVRDAVTGKGVPWAEVSGYSTASNSYLDARADAEGAFTALVRTATYSVQAVADGYRTDNLRTTITVHDGADLAGADLRIYATSWVGGRVTLGGKGLDSFVWFGDVPSHSSPTGVFHEQVEPGVSVSPWVDSGSSNFRTYLGNTVRKPDAKKVSVSLGRSVTNADIALVRTATVTGTVVNRNGKPAKRATVEAQSVGRAGSARATTDSKGRYTLRGLPSGKVTISVWGGTRAVPAHGVTTLTAQQGHKVAASRLTLSRDAIAYGRIKTTGSRVSKQDVTVTTSKGVWLGTFRPDAEGWVGVAGLSAGTYYIHVDGSNLRKKVVVKAHAVVDFGVISRGKQVTVKGVVRTANGQPAVGARIAVVDSHGTSYGVVRTNAKGAYSLKGAVSGRYTVTAKPRSGTDAWTSASVTVTKGRALTQSLRFGKGATVTGVVLNSKGKPAIGVRVETLDGRSAKTNASGVYAITGARAGRTEIRVSDPSYVGGYRDAYTTATAKAGKTVRAKTVSVR